MAFFREGLQFSLGADLSVLLRAPPRPPPPGWPGGRPGGGGPFSMGWSLAFSGP